jgi:hypothetical protein
MSISRHPNHNTVQANCAWLLADDFGCAAR